MLKRETTSNTSNPYHNQRHGRCEKRLGIGEIPQSSSEDFFLKTLKNSSQHLLCHNIPFLGKGNPFLPSEVEPTARAQVDVVGVAQAREGGAERPRAAESC